MHLNWDNIPLIKAFTHTHTHTRSCDYTLPDSCVMMNTSTITDNWESFHSVYSETVIIVISSNRRAWPQKTSNHYFYKSESSRSLGRFIDTRKFYPRDYLFFLSFWEINEVPASSSAVMWFKVFHRDTLSFIFHVSCLIPPALTSDRAGEVWRNLLLSRLSWGNLAVSSLRKNTENCLWLNLVPALFVWSAGSHVRFPLLRFPLPESSDWQQNIMFPAGFNQFNLRS